MTQTAKERPIIFSAEMVRAILAGRKTQTRRVVKPQPVHDDKAWACYFERPNLDGRYGPPSWGMNEHPGSDMLLYCPYGSVGDALWVRETWQQIVSVGRGQWSTCNLVGPMRGSRIVYAADCDEEPPCWKSPIIMPRWASRITLEITGLRIERLNAISLADVAAEGVGGVGRLARVAFAQRWDAINGKKHPWSSDPWVWVVEFARRA